MRKEEFKEDQRSVSELYGTVLIISLAFLTALLLVGGGWVIVDQITSESQDTIAQDQMRNVDRGIEDITGTSVNETTTFEIPEDTGTDYSADEREGVFNVTIETNTTNGNYWQRVVAGPNGEGLDRVGLADDETVLGTIRHEAEDGTVTAYQGGALFRQPPGGNTIIETEPNFDYTGETLDLGVVNLTGVDAITEGSSITASRNAESTVGEELQLNMSKYWRGLYDPTFTAPVNISINITSKYYDGWQTYAEEGMTQQPDQINLHPGQNKVELIFKIGGEMREEENPTFGHEDILYSGVPEWAYRYQNDTEADGAFKTSPTNLRDSITSPELDPSEFAYSPSDPTTPPLNKNATAYQLALYNESGQWLIYENDDGLPGGNWTDYEGNVVNVSATEAINLSRADAEGTDNTGGSKDPAGNEIGDGISDGTTEEFYLDPSSWLQESGSAPICVVTSNNTDIREFLDDDDADCLETMVGVNEDLVDPLQTAPEFNITVEEDTGFADNMYPGEKLEVDVNLTNEGNGVGQVPIGVYVINGTNWKNENLGEAYPVAGTKTADNSLDPGDYKEPGYEITLFDEMAKSYHQNWSVFATTGTDLDWVSETGDTTPVDEDDIYTIEVLERDTEFEIEDWNDNVTVTGDLKEGETVEFEVEVNETENSMPPGEEQTQRVRLETEDRIVAQKEVTLEAGEKDTVTLEWSIGEGVADSEEVTISTYDDSVSKELDVDEGDVPTPAFDVDDVAVENSEYDAGETVLVTANVTNVGDAAGNNQIALNVSKGEDTQIPSFKWIDEDPNAKLNPGQTTTVQLLWDTSPADGGDYTLAAEIDGNSSSTSVEIIPATGAEPELSVSIDESDSLLTVVENETITVDATVTLDNPGEISGNVEREVVLRNFDNAPVTTEAITLNASSTEADVTLPWRTYIGYANETNWDATNQSSSDGFAADINVTAGDAADQAEATIEPKERQRDPVDVVFALDETGSMGNPQSGYLVDDDPSTGDTYSVPDGELWRTEEVDSCFFGTCYYDRLTEGYSKGTLTVGPDADRVYAYTDGSGNDGLAQRIGATRNAIGALEAGLGDTAGAISYSSQFYDTKTLASPTTDLDSVNESLERYASGNTPIGNAMYESREQVLNAPNDEKFVILLTDGQHNHGPDPVTAANDIDEDIAFYTVGFGNPNENTLKYVANNAGNGEGEYYEGEDASELSEIFKGIVDDVTEPDLPEFRINDVEAPVSQSEPVDVGTDVQVEVTVENVGPGGGERPVILKGPSGVPIASETTAINSRDAQTVSFTWDTAGTDPGDKTLEVLTPSNVSDTTVQLADNSPDTDFVVDEILDSQTDIELGETVTVEARIENNGETGNGTVSLITDENDNRRDVTDSIEIPSGGQKDVTLEWTPTSTDVPGDEKTYDAYLETSDGDVTDSIEITIDDPSVGNDPILEVTSITNNPSPVTMRSDFVPEVEVENSDGSDGTGSLQMELENADSDNSITIYKEGITVGAGNTSLESMTLDTTELEQIGGPGEYDFTITTFRGSQEVTGTVEVKPPETPFTITNIQPNPDEVVEGEQIEFGVTIEKEDSSPIEETNVVINDTKTDTIVDYQFDIKLEDKGDTTTRTLTWDTWIGTGNDTEAREIAAEIPNTDESERTPVQINEGDTNIRGPAREVSGDLVNIDLEEIEIDS